MLNLFENKTRSQIFWNLIVYKELSAAKLAKMLNRNISTITRNLDLMNESGLVEISRVGIKKNLQVKYWKIIPDVLKGTSELDLDSFKKMNSTEKKKAIKQFNNFIVLCQSIIQNILSQSFEESNTTLNLAMLLFDKKTGKLFREKLSEFISEFLKENESKTIHLDDLGLNTNIFLILQSLVKHSVPSKHNKQDKKRNNYTNGS